MTTLHLMQWLMAFTIAALLVSLYANIRHQRVLANWAAAAVFLFGGTVQLLAGSQHWLVYMTYGNGALQVGVAIREQLQGPQIG